MQKIPQAQTYSRQAFRYTGSKVLERTSYYGIRAILMLYMVKEIGIGDEEASITYGNLMGLLTFAMILGGILGDFVLGNKRAMIIGGLIQTAGAFVLCIPNIYGVYIGFGMVMLGGGLYSPNMIAQYGKLFLQKKKLMDGAFTLFFFATNLGALLGASVIAYFFELNFVYGFITAGILMLLSVGLLLFNDSENVEVGSNVEGNENEKWPFILTAIMIILIVGIAMEISGHGIMRIQTNQLGVLGSFDSFITLIGPLVAFSLWIVATFVWSYYYTHSWVKIGAGIVSAIVGLGILLVFVGESANDLSILILAFIFWGALEILVWPAAYSIITRNVNPKYLATIFGSKTLLIGLLGAFVYPFLFSNVTREARGEFLIIGMAILGALGMGVLIFYLSNNKNDSFS